MLLGRPFKNPSMGAVGLGYGDDLKADFYFPIDADGSPRGSHWPVVVWMHPYSYSTGYSRDTQPFFASLTRRGFAVLAFDQIGFGTRVRDARYFYQRYPKWSLLGKMVTDTRAAVDAVAALEAVDPSRIYLVGYALGAKVGLVTAALDERVKGVAAVCGVDPLRLSGAEKGTEGVQHYSHLHGLLPRLGFFVGQESRLPFDFDEVLAAIAPRQTLIVAPTLDPLCAGRRRTVRGGKSQKGLRSPGARKRAPVANTPGVQFLYPLHRGVSPRLVGACPRLSSVRYNSVTGGFHMQHQAEPG